MLFSFRIAKREDTYRFFFFCVERLLVNCCCITVLPQMTWLKTTHLKKNLIFSVYQKFGHGLAGSFSLGSITWDESGIACELALCLLPEWPLGLCTCPGGTITAQSLRLAQSLRNPPKTTPTCLPLGQSWGAGRFWKVKHGLCTPGLRCWESCKREILI